ncbi:unnamed protein product [Brassica oleracea]
MSFRCIRKMLWSLITLLVFIPLLTSKYLENPTTTPYRTAENNICCLVMELPER